jgi:diaminopimelate epimerase
VTRTFGWLKGHGTENDFVLLPDADGSTHGELEPGLVAALCHRHRGIGADGVLRVIRSDALDDPAARETEAEWFMDYRNADGSAAQMCGNGLRVFARYLAESGLVDPDEPLRIGTRDGTRTVHFDGELVSTEMGAAQVLGAVVVGANGREWPALHVDVGNPHAVAPVEQVADAGPLTTPPAYDTRDFPDGVNVEFVARQGKGQLAMRVFERGVGETRSCGTGACAAVAAAASVDDDPPAAYRVQVLGGLLEVSLHDGDMTLTGPAVIVANGKFSWGGA